MARSRFCQTAPSFHTLTRHSVHSGWQDIFGADDYHACMNKLNFKRLSRMVWPCWLLLMGVGTSALAAEPAYQAELIETRVISPEFDLYGGWPTVARRKNGELLLVWSGGREAHVCPFGQVHMMTSRDQGKTWSWPRVVHDSAIDDRDSGVLETAQGSILVTTFSSLAFEPILSKAEQGNSWPPEKLTRWQAARDRLTREQRQAELGTWLLRSTDDGRSFSQRIDSLVNSPHGPIQLADGRLLYAGKELWKAPHRIGVAISENDGVSWKWLATIPTREGDDSKNYHELHAVEAGNGHLIVQIRNHNRQNHLETLQTESTDGGKTWSVPHAIGVWGYPSHLLKLKDGRLLMTYGHRRQPLGNQARLSTDHGKTWSEPMLISKDAASGDLGYPSTVELDDGSLLTVWYERMAQHPYAVLRQAHWKIKPASHR